MSTRFIFTKSFVYAGRGLLAVWREEINFRIETIVAVLVLFATWYFNFSFVETVAVVLAVFLVLTAEVVNTALEDLCNKVEPNTDASIAKIKDVMAGYVLLSSLGALVIGILTLINHFK